MASDQLVPKDALIRQMREIALRNDTGLLSVVTDTGRAVLVRFSKGKIVGAHSRTKDIGEAVTVLLQAQNVRFAYVPSTSEGKREGIAELMPVGAFIEGIAPTSGGRNLTGPAHAPERPPAQTPVSRVPNPPTGSVGISQGARGILVDLCVEIVGPIAQFLVEEALETASTLRDAVEQIARSIPDRDVSSRFVGEVRRRLPEID